MAYKMTLPNAGKNSEQLELSFIAGQEKANGMATVEESLAKHNYIIQSSSHTPSIYQLI